VAKLNAAIGQLEWAKTGRWWEYHLIIVLRSNSRKHVYLVESFISYRNKMGIRFRRMIINWSNHLSQAIMFEFLTLRGLGWRGFYNLSDKTKIQFNLENLFDEEYFPAAHNDIIFQRVEPD